MAKNKMAYKDLIDFVGRCELCGSRRSMEVHHIIPRVCCENHIDSEDEDNLIVLCSACHSRLTPRRLLTKYGITKMALTEQNNDRPPMSRRDYLKMKYFWCNLTHCETSDDICSLVEFVWGDYLSDDMLRERAEELNLPLDDIPLDFNKIKLELSNDD